MTSYNEFFESLTPVFYDEEEHQREKSAAHQMELDALYRIGCQYDIAKADMALLCQLANVSVQEFFNYSGVSA